MNHCNNCGVAFEGKYCHNCGQKAGIARLHMHDMWHEVWHAFTHADKGILKLIKDLVMHPAVLYRHYFEGQRKYYFSPVLFYVLTAGLSIYLGDHIFEYENKVNHMNNEYGKFVLDHTKLLGLFLLPLEALLTWALFRKRFNLAECAVFWLFANGLVFVFKIAITPLYFALIQHKSVIDYGVEMLGYLILLWQLIANFAWRKDWKAYVRCIILINIIIVLNQYTAYYFLFETDAFHQSFFKMVRDAYLP